MFVYIIVYPVPAVYPYILLCVNVQINWCWYSGTRQLLDTRGRWSQRRSSARGGYRYLTRKPHARCQQWARDRDRSSVDPFRRRSWPSCHALQLLQTDPRRATPPPHNPWQYDEDHDGDVARYKWKRGFQRPLMLYAASEKQKELLLLLLLFLSAFWFFIEKHKSHSFIVIS